MATAIILQKRLQFRDALPHGGDVGGARFIFGGEHAQVNSLSVHAKARHPFAVLHVNAAIIAASEHASKQRNAAIRVLLAATTCGLLLAMFYGDDATAHNSRYFLLGLIAVSTTCLPSGHSFSALYRWLFSFVSRAYFSSRFRRMRAPNSYGACAALGQIIAKWPQGLVLLYERGFRRIGGFNTFALTQGLDRKAIASIFSDGSMQDRNRFSPQISSHRNVIIPPLPNGVRCQSDVGFLGNVARHLVDAPRAIYARFSHFRPRSALVVRNARPAATGWRFVHTSYSAT